MKNNLIIIAIVSLLIGAGAGFFGGMKFQQSKTSAYARQMGNRNFQNGNNAQGQRTQNGTGGMNFRPVAGNITSADDKSVTVKMADGSSKIVILADSTKITKGADATKEDLKVGESIMVTGTTNSDGSVTAQNIQLNPQQFRGGPDIPSTTSVPQPL